MPARQSAKRKDHRAARTQKDQDLTDGQIPGEALDEHILKRETGHCQHHQGASAQVFHAVLSDEPKALSSCQKYPGGGVENPRIFNAGGWPPEVAKAYFLIGTP